MAENKRFVKIYTQNGFINNTFEIYVDTVTGVNYLYAAAGYGAGLTPLLNRDGTPVVSKLPIEE